MIDRLAHEFPPRRAIQVRYGIGPPRGAGGDKVGHLCGTVPGAVDQPWPAGQLTGLVPFCFVAPMWDARVVSG